MPLSKTISLYQLLGKKEREELDFVIKNKRKTAIKKLHHLVNQPSSRKKIQQRESLFEELFNEKLTPKKDYLLRNELRVYHDLIKEIIAKEYLVKDSNLLTLMTAKGLEKRGHNELHLTEIKKGLASELKGKNKENVADLYAMLIKNQVANQRYTIDYFQELKDTIQEQISYLTTAFNEKLKKAEVSRAFVERVLEQLSGNAEYSPTTTSINLDSENFNTEYTKILSLQSQIYLPNKKEKVEILREILEILPGFSHPNENTEVLFSKISTSLGVELLLKGNYSEANVHFKNALINKAHFDQRFFIGFLLNYLSSLAKAGDFETAKLLLDEHAHSFPDSIFSERIISVAVSIYLLCDEVEKAEQLMPHNLKEGENDAYHYLRVLQAIIHYKNNHHELAENELINLKKHFGNTSGVVYKTSKILGKFVTEYFKMEESIDKATQQKNRCALVKKIEMFVEEYGQFNSDNLIVLWLRKQLDC